MFSIVDLKAGAFMAPFFMVNKAMAIRAFQGGCENRDTAIGQFPGDFVLYHLGRFDANLGKFDILDVPDVLYTGASYVASKGVK